MFKPFSLEGRKDLGPIHLSHVLLLWVHIRNKYTFRVSRNGLVVVKDLLIRGAYFTKPYSAYSVDVVNAVKGIKI